MRTLLLASFCFLFYCSNLYSSGTSFSFFNKLFRAYFHLTTCVTPNQGVNLKKKEVLNIISSEAAPDYWRKFYREYPSYFDELSDEDFSVLFGHRITIQEMDNILSNPNPKRTSTKKAHDLQKLVGKSNRFQKLIDHVRDHSTDGKFFVGKFNRRFWSSDKHDVSKEFEFEKYLLFRGDNIVFDFFHVFVDVTENPKNVGDGTEILRYEQKIKFTSNDGRFDHRGFIVPDLRNLPNVKNIHFRLANTGKLISLKEFTNDHYFKTIHIPPVLEGLSGYHTFSKLEQDFEVLEVGKIHKFKIMGEQYRFQMVWSVKMRSPPYNKMDLHSPKTIILPQKGIDDKEMIRLFYSSRRIQEEIWHAIDSNFTKFLEPPMEPKANSRVREANNGNYSVQFGVRTDDGSYLDLRLVLDPNGNIVSLYPVLFD